MIDTGEEVSKMRKKKKKTDEEHDNSSIWRWTSETTSVYAYLPIKGSTNRCIRVDFDLLTYSSLLSSSNLGGDHSTPLDSFHQLIGPDRRVGYRLLLDGWFTSFAFPANLQVLFKFDIFYSSHLFSSIYHRSPGLRSSKFRSIS